MLGGSKPHWNYASALQSMRARGPDSQQIFRHADLTLGFVRLAIRDLSPSADQPMTDHQTGQVRIVFNGELYGFENVRQQLLEHGFQFRGTSDTEVALNAYLHWGPNFVQRIDGMFALAIHDDRTKQLHLYRDRAGIKPLYYLHQGQRIAFGSELNAIESLIDDQSLTVDKTALYDFAVLGYVPAPKSVYREVQQLQPAYRRSIDVRTRHTLYHGAYWKLPVEADSRITTEQAQTQVRALLHSSVAEQLQADVPVGCFLSGGIDSSIVAAEASRSCPGLPSFCLHFPRSPQSEAGFARQVADRLHLNHHQFDFQRIHDPASELMRL
jgi:asparagine synthase (glutamine-hydrolysing)